MSKKGCCAGMASGCVLLVIFLAALVFFAINWYEYQEVAAERNHVPVLVQIKNSMKKLMGI